jgi:hypothetical protein
MGHGFFDLGGWERSFEADVVWAKGARVIPQMWRRLPLPLRGGVGVVRLGEALRKEGAVAACELFI